MAHWSALTATTVRSDEWRVLRAMDRVFLRACRDLADREKDASDNPHMFSERPMTPELFDAIFQ